MALSRYCMGDRIITSDTGGLLRRSVFLGAEHHAQRHGTTALTAAREHVRRCVNGGLSVAFRGGTPLGQDRVGLKPSGRSDFVVTRDIVRKACNFSESCSRVPASPGSTFMVLNRRRAAILVTASLLGCADRVRTGDSAGPRVRERQRPGHDRLDPDAALERRLRANHRAHQPRQCHIQHRAGPVPSIADRRLGLTSTRADLEALFDKNSTEPLAARLARVSARAIIPELAAERQAGDTRQLSVYRNVTLSDIAQGRIAKLTADSSSIEVKGPKQNATLTQGRTTAEEIDAAEAARIYMEKAGPQPEPLSRLYGAFSVENIKIQDKEGTVTIAHGSGRDVRGRRTEDSWAGTASLVRRSVRWTSRPSRIARASCRRWPTFWARSRSARRS